MIRVDDSNPGHFREYTIRELRMLAEAVGLEVEGVSTHSYFDMRFAHHGEAGIRPKPVMGALKNFAYGLLPASLRYGITTELRRGDGDAMRS
jgi:hypothetical protein